MAEFSQQDPKHCQVQYLLLSYNDNYSIHSISHCQKGCQLLHTTNPLPEHCRNTYANNHKHGNLGTTQAVVIRKHRNFSTTDGFRVIISANDIQNARISNSY